MSFTPGSELQTAIEAVSRAGVVIRRIQDALLSSPLAKDDRSPVTVADFTSQAIVAHVLASQLGDVTLVAEEDTTLLKKDEHRDSLAKVVRFVSEEIPGLDQDGVCAQIDFGACEPTDSFWTLDPIDGTKGFLRGDHYAVALGYVVDGAVELAALACPKLADPARPGVGAGGSVLFAARGRGAWLLPLVDQTESPRPLVVSNRGDPATARLLGSVEAAHTNKGTAGEFATALAVTETPVGLDSQAKYAVLAGGGAEILTRFLSAKMPDYREMIWDQAAGSLIVEEAGGRVTDLDGGRLDFSQGRTLAKNRGVLATNGALHDAALAAIRRIGA